MNKQDHLDIVSAIWILASNDENNLITYEGIKLRLGLEESFDIKQLIKLHAELFRSATPPRPLNAWKEEMYAGRKIPLWITAEIKAKDEQEKAAKLKAKIDSFTPEDIFRSQFRTQLHAPASPVSVIDWGLQHIERLRKAALDNKQDKSRVVTTMVVPIISLLISLVAVISSWRIQVKNMDNQNVMKKMEIEYDTKKDGYVKFMKSTVDAYTATIRHDNADLLKSLDEIEVSYFSIQHLLDSTKTYNIWQHYLEFSHMCYDNVSKKDQNKSFTDSCVTYKNLFKNELQLSLFGKSLKQ